MEEKLVQRLKAYCEERQVETAEDDDLRNAYNLLERYITTMRPRKDELYAALAAWVVDRRLRVQEIRANGVGLALADTLETSAQVYEELAELVTKNRKIEEKGVCAMMFDDIKGTQQELVEHVQAVCRALSWLRDVDPRETLDPGPVHDEWVKHMNALNHACVRLGMGAEYLHDELNHHNDQVIYAGRGDYTCIIER